MSYGGYEVGAAIIPASPGQPLRQVPVLIPRTIAQPQGVAQPVGSVIPPRSERQILCPLPLSRVIWTNASTDTTVDMTGRYQEGTRGLTRRFCLNRTNPITVPATPPYDGEVVVNSIFVGNTNMTSGRGPISVEAFNPLNPSFIEFPSVIITSGMDVTVSLEIDAIPGVGQTVSVTGYVEVMAA